jgi:hypothetical protein
MGVCDDAVILGMGETPRRGVATSPRSRAMKEKSFFTPARAIKLRAFNLWKTCGDSLFGELLR